MATTEKFQREKLQKSNPALTRCRSIIETAFYGNRVREVSDLAEAYRLAMEVPGTIVTDQPVLEWERLGLPSDARVLLHNDGRVVERTLPARKHMGDGVFADDIYTATLREALYRHRQERWLHGTAYVGMDRSCMVKAHLLVPEEEAHILYNWLLNFQAGGEEAGREYRESVSLKNEGDVYLLGIPGWQEGGMQGALGLAGTGSANHTGTGIFPQGLSLFDGRGNCGALLGLSFFVEYKKATLSLAWGVAERNGFLPVHGGLKQYLLPEGKKETVLYVGLTGAGKSVFMNHTNKRGYQEILLHDDALMIEVASGRSVSMEPSYYDKTRDFPYDTPENQYVVTAQNMGVTRDREGQLCLLAEDLRNDNGRVIRSIGAHGNRVLRVEEAPTRVFWLMKDPTLPPVLKISSPALSVALGATLSNMKFSPRDTDLLKESEPLSIQPFANPFRTWPVGQEYQAYRKLLEEHKVESFVLNTGYFMGSPVSKEVSISLVELIISGEAQFVPWKPLEGLEILEIKGYPASLEEASYRQPFVQRLKERLAFLKKMQGSREATGDFPGEAIGLLEKLLAELA